MNTTVSNWLYHNKSNPTPCTSAGNPMKTKYGVMPACDPGNNKERRHQKRADDSHNGAPQHSAQPKLCMFLISSMRIKVIKICGIEALSNLAHVTIIVHVDRCRPRLQVSEWASYSLVLSLQKCHQRNVAMSSMNCNRHGPLQSAHNQVTLLTAKSVVVIVLSHTLMMVIAPGITPSTIRKYVSHRRPC